jgi:hypothetical protein
MDTFYDIYSTGKLVEGANPAETRAALARLFKTSEDKIAHLMAGKPQLIKRRIEKAEALRYKATLHQAGLLIGIKISETAANTATQSTAESVSTSQAPAESTGNDIKTSPATETAQPHYSFSLATTGSDLLHANEKTPFEKRDIDTSGLKLAPTFFMAETVDEVPVATPDTSHLILAEVGSILGNTEEKPPVAAPDVSHISVAEVGASLDEIKPNVIPLNPDTSNLSLAETGVDLVPAEYRKPAPPPAPSTDHIQLEQ